MRRFFALARKELWDHGLVVLGLYLLLGGVAALLLLGAVLAPRTITMLEAHATFVRFFVPMSALALGHRLVVREYQAGTQRFLEALPLRRFEVVITKLVVGLAVLSIAALGSLALSASAALLREPLTVRWLALVGLKTELFTIACFAVLFTMGLFGRWRIPIYLGFAFLLGFLGQATDVELSRFGPFALVGERLVLEREVLPLSEIAVTLGLTALALAIAFTLALVREGQVAEALARRMSAREKSAVAVVLVFGLIASEIADAHRAKEPFAFTRDEVVRRQDPPVAVLYLDERHRVAAEALADTLARDLDRLRETLGIAAMPAVHVALSETLDPNEVERVELDDRDGVLVRASFTAPAFDPDALRVAVVERVVERVTDGRAAFEPYAWVRTGFARAFVDRPEVARAPMLRALWIARQRSLSASMLERWQRTEERWGPAGAEALAYSAYRALEARAGRARTIRFARSLLAEEPPWGMAAVMEARMDPVPARMERETGVSMRALVEAWREEVAGWRADPRAAALRRVPRARGAVTIERAEGELRALRWRIDDPPTEGMCALVHAPLGPFDRPLRRDELVREERPCAELDPSGEAVVGRYGPGERVLAAIELDGDVLGAPVRVFAARMEVP